MSGEISIKLIYKKLNKFNLCLNGRIEQKTKQTQKQ